MKDTRRIILNVDHNQEMLKLLEHTMNLTRAVKGYPWDVVSTDNISDALAFIDDAKHVDLAVFNASMPLMGGYELAVKLRDKFESTPIIFQSSQDTGYTSEKIKALDNSAYMLLPFDLKEFSMQCEKKLKKG